MQAETVPGDPAPPEATVALNAALDALDFNIATPFQRRGRILADPEVVALAVAMTRPKPRGRRREG